MNYYSQKNPSWKDQQLGDCNDTIGNSGCKVSCFAMLISDKIKNPNGTMSESTPSIVDWIATKKSLYSNGCLINDKIFSDYFDLEYNGKSTEAPDYPCIAETDHYKDKGFAQHFFIHLTNGQIIDPLDKDPKKKDNPYNIVSYRLIKPKGYSENTNCEDCYKRLNEANKIIKDLEKKLKEINNISKI